MSEGGKGVWAMVAACTVWPCTVWGLSPLFYALLVHVPPLEVLGYRCLWSLVFFAAILGWQGRVGLVGAALTTRRGLVIVTAAAVAIAANWFGLSMPSRSAIRSSLVQDRAARRLASSAATSAATPT